MGPRFLRPEVLPYVSVARLTDSAPPPKPPVICAWCPDFDPTTQPPGLSHGMCQACSDKALFETMHSIDRVDDDREERDELGGSTCGGACGYCGRCS